MNNYDSRSVAEGAEGTEGVAKKPIKLPLLVALAAGFLLLRVVLFGVFADNSAGLSTVSQNIGRRVLDVVWFGLLVFSVSTYFSRIRERHVTDAVVADEHNLKRADSRNVIQSVGDMVAELERFANGSSLSDPVNKSVKAARNLIESCSAIDLVLLKLGSFDSEQISVQSVTDAVSAIKLWLGVRLKYVCSRLGNFKERRKPVKYLALLHQFELDCEVNRGLVRSVSDELAVIGELDVVSFDKLEGLLHLLNARGLGNVESA
jgi:hypothetical protein